MKSGYLSIYLKEWKWHLSSQRVCVETRETSSQNTSPQAASRVAAPICRRRKNCLNPNWWFLNTIFGALERVTYGKSIRQLILKTKTWRVRLLINSSAGACATSATGVLTTINPHFGQGEPYWHIFLIWIFNYSVVPHQIIVKLGTQPDRFTQLQRRSRVSCSHEICQSWNHISATLRGYLTPGIRVQQVFFFLLGDLYIALCGIRKGEEWVGETMGTDRR